MDYLKSFCLLVACCLFATTLRAAPLQPDAGGVTLEVPEEGRIGVDTTLSVSFPSAMVATDKIDLGGQPSPVSFSPTLPGEWLWKSQTDGEFQVKKPVASGQTYTASLARGLRDVEGKPVAPPGWGAELHTEAFTVETDFQESDQLSTSPGIVLKFTAPVRLDDAAKHIYFRDRDSGARQEAELSLREEDRNDEPEAAVLRATPLAPLPVGRTWDLLVEDVRAQDAAAPLPYLKRVPLGVTAPLKIRWVGAFNQPLAKPLIRVRFDGDLDPATVKPDAVTVEPPLPNLAVRADEDDLIIEGDFDLAKHYAVTVDPSIKAGRGYGLAAPAHWGATFHPKTSALFFPDSRVSERAALGLRFSFLQVHTGALRWRLAAVPLEKLAAVNKRVREFEQSNKNPFSGEPEEDDTGDYLPQPTELLVDAFGLETRAQGTFPASEGEAETLRDLRWSPPGGKGMPCGAYLLEVDGPRWDGKGTVGHRSLVFFSESVITEKRTPDTVFARVAGMADGLPRAGVVVRALAQFPRVQAQLEPVTREVGFRDPLQADRHGRERGLAVSLVRFGRSEPDGPRRRGRASPALRRRHDQHPPAREQLPQQRQPREDRLGFLLLPAQLRIARPQPQRVHLAADCFQGRHLAQLLHREAFSFRVQAERPGERPVVDQHQRLLRPVAGFVEQHRQQEIVRLPHPARRIPVGRAPEQAAAGQAQQRLAGERVQGLASSLVLHRQEVPLLEVAFPQRGASPRIRPGQQQQQANKRLHGLRPPRLQLRVAWVLGERQPRTVVGEFVRPDVRRRGERSGGGG